MIRVDFLDEDNNIIKIKNLDTIGRGQIGKVKVIRVTNVFSKVVGVHIHAVEGLNQKGTKWETYRSTFLSLDNYHFSNEVVLNMESDETVEVYIKWSPPNDSRGDINVEWDLMLEVFNEQKEVFCT